MSDILDLEFKQKDIICTFCYKIKDSVILSDFYSLKWIISNRNGEYDLDPKEMEKRFFDFLFLLSKKYDVDMISEKEKQLLKLNLIDMIELMSQQILGWFRKRMI